MFGFFVKVSKIGQNFFKNLGLLETEERFVL